MFCKYCGKSLEDDARFCPSCGSSVNRLEEPEQTKQAEETAVPQNSKSDIENTQSAETQSSAPRKLHVMGLVGFILSCASFLIGFSDLAIISVAGFIVSLIGLIQFNKNPKKYKLKGFAIAGVSIGAVGVFLFFIFMFATCALTCALLSLPETWSGTGVI